MYPYRSVERAGVMEDQPVRTLRVGIVGAGAWSRAAHVPGFQSTPGVHLVAICDADISRAQQVADEAGISRAYASAATMLADEAVDIVSIVTPDDCHRADVELAIAAGVHILCEKPLATTSEDVYTGRNREFYIGAVAIVRSDDADDI